MGWEVAGMVVTFGAVLVCAVPLGRYIARVFSGERTFLSPKVLRPA